MRIVDRILGTDSGSAKAESKRPADAATTLGDGAIDTLGHVIRVLGQESFQLEHDVDPEVFPQMCTEFAAHVENGAAVPSFDIPRAPDGTRHWGRVRRFFTDRRQAEKQFVTERLKDYRGVVEDLVNGLREIGERDKITRDAVKRNLNSVEDAVSTGVLPQIRKALTQTVADITATFAKQQKEYEKQLSELNQRMSSLRQDLVAAHEEMKRDPLTDLYNRGAFDTAIEHSVNMHFILNQPVTVIMVDLDNFKEVNDVYGHAAGDEVLRAVSNCLARCFIRKSDFVARYGGDEFVIILNDTSARNSKRLVDRFLACAHQIEIPYAPEGQTISCSAGFTEIHEADTVETLMSRADRALYRAKRSGRNIAEFEACAAPPPSS